MKRWLIPAGLTILQLLVGLSPLLPYLRNLWGATVQAELVPTIIGINFALLSTTLVTMLATEEQRRNAADKAREDKRTATEEREGERLRQGQAEILTKLEEMALIEPLSAHQFYPHFMAAMKAAETRVFISYFAPYPPDKTADPDRLQYYKEQAELPSQPSRSRVAFRRIVRYSDENRAWLRQLVSETKGKTNSDLAFIRDAAGANKMPAALSVQVVDDSHVWLVAVEVHEHSDRHRDLYIRNRRVADAMAKYHQRLWNLSTKLVQSGALTRDGEALLKEGTAS